MPVFILLILMTLWPAPQPTDTTDATCPAQWLAHYDTVSGHWSAVPVADIEAKPVPLPDTLPAVPLLWSETGLAYVTPENHLMLYTPDETLTLVEEAGIWGQAWSHSGRFFAYSYNIDELHYLDVYDTLNGQTTRLVPPLTFWAAYIELRWSPDDTILAAYLAYPPAPEQVEMIDTRCLTDPQQDCSSRYLADPAQDEATGLSMPVWDEGTLLYGCSGWLCQLTDAGLDRLPIEEPLIKRISAQYYSPCGDYALIKNSQKYTYITGTGEQITEFPREAMPFFLAQPSWLMPDS